MASMKRHLITQLETWKNGGDRQPLLLLGARQVGKTWLMQEFGRTHFSHTAYVRFDNDPAMRLAFEQDFHIPRLLDAIRIRTGVPVLPQETLIILDEIQECPAALTSLKYFCEEFPEYAVIAAGSLLGLEELYGTGFPVGKVERLTLYPMSFAEFVEALDGVAYAELLAKRDFGMMRTFSDKFEEMLRYYYYIGGMPRVVSDFVQNRDFNKVRTIQKRLLDDYRADFRKHTAATTARAMGMLWDSIPAQLAQENKRFTYAEVSRQAGEKVKSARFHEPLAWLQAAGLVCPVKRVRLPELPLSAYTDEAFKLFFLDVGLLAAMCELPAAALLEQNRMFGQFKGALTEQYVQQELRTHGLTPYYWAGSQGQAEVDFLISVEGRLLPIEAKAERRLQAKSLPRFCRRYAIKEAIRTSMHPDYAVREMGAPGGEPYAYQLTDIPLYAISCLT